MTGWGPLVAAAPVDTLPPADDRLYGPYPYGAGWLAAGVVAVLVAVALVAWARRPLGPPRPAETVDGPTVRARYLGQLDDLERRLARHQVDTRTVHHELSRTLRHFAADVGTAGAPAMSAGDLDRAGRRDVAGAVRRYERPQFAYRADADPQAAIDLARAVVVGGPDATHGPDRSYGPDRPEGREGP